ncbi:protein kinase domain-containing protein [Pseudomarimonas arenosa]|uniref:Serine/threonine protein kinase n=1 Tax=Pseudomarimonas arenosa TaxID=2774145 RepID=A0AAW3ZQZ4_9GAMM|nr:protein kinase [Pseudomarimonas arenosa]MBD8527899.1 serine/threonine protein kinase [Pseudomarimonas arenosa]
MRAAPDPKVWAEAEALWEEAEQQLVNDIDSFLAERPDTGAATASLLRQLWSERDVEQSTASAALTSQLSRLAAQASMARGREGLRIGRFSLIEQLGEGGAGVVYLAEERQDDLLHRVAIKLLHQPFERDDEVLGSALHERRLLARLSHPCITRYYESGLTDEGLFYVVVELVDGLPITRHIEQNDLGLLEALALFEQVVRAVHYAHQNLIVHRDLKPSNILVEGQHGLPKLLDFGIARDLQGRRDDEQTQVFACTPAYASPEQLSGSGTIGTPSDLYSLGVILHEIVYGELPVSSGQLHPLARLEKLAAWIAKPVTATSCARSLRQVSQAQCRDLATLIARLLSMHVEDRYPSAAALSEDLERLRRDRPIRYAHHSLGRRVWRWVDRHRALSATATLAFSIALSSAGVYVQQSRSLAQQASRLSSLSSVLTNLLTRPDPLRRGNSVTLADTVKEMSPELLADSSMDPVVRAELQTILGQTLLRLGEIEQADALLLQADAYYSTHDSDGLPWQDIAQLRALSDLEAGRYQSARQRSRALVDQLAKRHPEQILRRATALRILATSDIHADRDLQSAQKHARQAFELLQEAGLLDEEEALTTQTVWALALSLDNQLQAAANLQARVLSEVESRFGVDSGQSFDPRNNLARTWEKLGKLDQAEALLAANAELAKQHFGELAPDTLLAINNLALTYFRQERYEQAAPLMQAVYQGRAEVLGEQHPRTSLAASNWADALIKIGEIERACELSLQASQALRSNANAAPQMWGYPAKVHARCLAESAQFDAALTELDAVLALWQQHLGEHHLDTLSAREDRIAWLAELGRTAQARRELEQVIQLRLTHYGAEHPRTQSALLLRERLVTPPPP